MNQPVQTPAPHAPHAPYGRAPVNAPAQTRRPRRWRWVLGVVVPAAAAAGLLVFGHGSVSAADVGTSMTDKFGAQVSCTDDLEAKVGATITCIGHDTDGSTHHILVRATAVDGSHVDFEGTVQD